MCFYLAFVSSYQYIDMKCMFFKRVELFLSFNYTFPLKY
jgi:hypothetical protein